MRYLLDTNICIYAIKNRPAQVLARLRAHEADGLGISSISVAELFFGAVKSGSTRNLEALRHFLEPLEIAEFDLPAAEAYGAVRHGLERAGTPIGPLDTQIAAHALALDAVLVTNNTREFERVQGLRVENWAVST
ncbi:MAG TPA: type II toxin-antitoxin system VapC family toxin [Thiobacillaceae bacterium]|nr:type II toxin-antitoxin system VapC family toxin [Thiobacillaceae bacterium]HNA83302.1 type II toxin-antitoxin system VapC family toxin [Thiobacillaceae bacterium]HNF89904.1 type II toxin-antitoxin system VapC family toxin [Thiobacillaceae bacterium]HNH90341.1 type II toxin-antitoxin system VapC family toxin [Thiobacillaceae bacterium]HNI08690.1 type II toxin-antitoxin system VapC family toxin [Thiobacillaceae bacterium]